MSVTVIYTTTQAKIADLVLDAAEQETHQSDVEVTSHNVEQGANITDHARVKPEKCTIQGLVSNTPVNHPQELRAVSVKGATFQSSAGTGPGGVVGKAEDAYTTLRKIRDARELVSVVTSLRTYKNMMLTSLSVPRDGRSGDVFRFTAVFDEVRLVSVRKLTRTTQKKEPKANPKKDTGKTVAPKVTADDASIATQAIEASGLAPHFRIGRSGE